MNKTRTKPMQNNEKQNIVDYINQAIDALREFDYTVMELAWYTAKREPNLHTPILAIQDTAGDTVMALAKMRREVLEGTLAS